MTWGTMPGVVLEVAPWGSGIWAALGTQSSGRWLHRAFATQPEPYKSFFRYQHTEDSDLASSDRTWGTSASHLQVLYGPKEEEGGRGDPLTRLLPVSGTAARLYNACCTPSSYRKGKPFVGRI